MKTIIIFLFSISFFYNCKPTKSTENSAQSVVIKKDFKTTNDTIFNFENYQVGKLPGDWSQYFTGRGKITNWKVVDDKGNKVLAQLSQDRPNYHFNDVVFDKLNVKNVELEVKIKGVKGNMDQGGGFIWRFTDKNNYYVVRANPLEDNVVLYKVKNGTRTDLPVLGKGRTYGVDVKRLGNGWNTLKLIAVDNLFTVFLNGQQIFQVRDNTFTNKGKVGLWTKADAVTYFDDFRVGF